MEKQKRTCVDTGKMDSNRARLLNTWVQSIGFPQGELESKRRGKKGGGTFRCCTGGKDGCRPVVQWKKRIPAEREIHLGTAPRREMEKNPKRKRLVGPA